MNERVSLLWKAITQPYTILTGKNIWQLFFLYIQYEYQVEALC